MMTIPNILSILRIPLALLFFQSNPVFRVMAILLAMASDGLDGYIARKYHQISKLGTILDPLTDKLFVFVALAVLISEQRLTLWEASAMICRDFSVILFGIYLTITGKLSQYTFRSIVCGKVTTTFQFAVLLALTVEYSVPTYAYGIFILLGLLALGELFLERRKAEGS